MTRRRGRKSSIAVAVLCVVIVALVAAPIRAAEAREDAAQAAAESWLALVDGGKCQESWKEAAELFKHAVTAEQWEQAVSAVRGPLGEVVSRKVKSRKHAHELPGAPDGEYVVIQFETRFEKKASAIETVTPMLDPDGTWRVSGYFVK
jgi:hypothetical protein